MYEEGNAGEQAEQNHYSVNAFVDAYRQYGTAG